MLHPPLLIPPCAAFWDEAARLILRSELLSPDGTLLSDNFSSVRVLVPTVAHAQQLKAALAARMSGPFIPPRIATLSSLLALLPPARLPASGSERLMALYAELRQHAWLKQLFSAQRNSDLLPLAQTILALCDELTDALFPLMCEIPDAADARWQAALAQLSPSARELLSDEAQLVWSIWKAQLAANDPTVLRFAQMLELAGQPALPLVWISPVEPGACEQAFLAQYGARQTVLPITLDWRARLLPAAFTAAWPELADELDADVTAAAVAPPAGLTLSEARNLEDEAVRGAQTVVDWLAAGKQSIAIVAQDRLVARRIRALLERASVFVSDETGWRLSTTRAAAALAAWFDLVTSQAATGALLDLLKSPFIFADVRHRDERAMAIEMALRRANVAGGWNAIHAALAELAAERQLVERLQQQAARFTGQRHVLGDWVELTLDALDALGMPPLLASDPAGEQLLAMLDAARRDCNAMAQAFSFTEWRAFINLQLESTPFVSPSLDKRVVMLPLNGAHLRRFDAVLVIGADAAHLPSKPNETLFFANAVRRELGLATRESRQRQQLRDFAELLLTNDTVVVSWQAHKNGEPNPVSPWLARLQLALLRSGAGDIARHTVALRSGLFASVAARRPAPAAPDLLPEKLSASDYNRLVACPYQFFATRMLGLSAIDDIADLPEKRDYGDWLHRILRIYHEAVREQATAADARLALLTAISDQVFDRELEKSAAALGYYARWKKAMPAYVAWANEREQQGWQFEIGEVKLEKTIAWPGGSILLHGRIDRLDRNADGELAVLDYKTKNKTSLAKRLSQMEDHQLAFYGLLCEQPAQAAHYVALEPTGDKTGDAAAANYAQWQNSLGEHIRNSLLQISQGTSLQANGVESVCQYCDVRGLCRKGAWQ